MSNADVKVLIDRVNEVKIPESLHANLLTRLDQLDKLYGSPSFMMEYDRTVKYIDWITKIPWETTTSDNLDLENAARVLESHHYGLGEIKDRVLEYLAVMKLKKEKGEEKDISRAPILFFVGLVGTGKTTLLHLLIRSLGQKVHYCLISNPSLAINDLFYILAQDFSLSPYTNRKAKFIQEFTAFLEECRQRKERVLLIIDEAHVLSVKLLEEIRLLSNQGGQYSGILSIFLVGQPELNRHLSDARLLPLRQRIAIRFHLDPFDRDATASYINFRLRLAGARLAELLEKTLVP